MAAAASRASINTELFIGTLSAKVGLYQTKADPKKDVTFETAAPSGGTLSQGKFRGDERVVDEPDDIFASMAEQVAAHGIDPSVPGQMETGGPVEVGRAAASASPEDMAPADTFVPIETALVDDITGKRVERADIRKGVWVDGESGKHFVDLTEQLAMIDEATKIERIDVIKAIDGTQITRERVIGAFYVAPATGTEKGNDALVLRLVYEAAAEKRRALVVKFTTGKKQKLGVIVAHHRSQSLMLLEVVFTEDWRDAPARCKQLWSLETSTKATDARVNMMRQLLDANHGYREALVDQVDTSKAMKVELRKRAMEGEEQPTVVDQTPDFEPLPDDIDLLLVAATAAR